MRVAVEVEGTTWVARPDHGGSEAAPEERIGWEAVIFETDPPGVQRVVFRPAGWLNLATLNDLVAALREADAVRTRWQATAS